MTSSSMTPSINWLDQTNTQKDFNLTVEGPDGLANWFAQILMMLQTDRPGKGQRHLVGACPFGHIWWNEEFGIPQAWPLMPACPTRAGSRRAGNSRALAGALRAIRVEDEEVARMARQEGLETMKPELGIRSRNYSRNPWRYTKRLVGGTISAEANGQVDCIVGAMDSIGWMKGRPVMWSKIVSTGGSK